MSSLKRLARDPLLYFLAAGALLFAAYRVIVGPPAPANDGSTIEVDRAKLLTFMQYESVAFEPSFFSRQLDSMSDRQKRELVAKYIREEALYREAQAMGLSEGDYVIRRRMIEKMLYLIDDAATEAFAPTDAEIEAYYREHSERYEVAPSLTFTHVFIDPAIKRAQAPETLAAQMKRKLMAKGARFDDAPAYGDRFPYLQNYIDRDPAFIEHQLGAAFATALLSLAPSEHVWYGPIKSALGYHLVLVTRHEPAYLPALTSIRDVVRDDLLRDTLATSRDKAVAELEHRFKVEVRGLPLKPDEHATVSSTNRAP